MQYKILSPGSVNSSIVLPSSKSISNRALAIGALAGSIASITNLSDCDDTEVMQRWLTERPSTVDVGAAGTSMRFSTALLAVGQGEHVITGSERMKNRPIKILVDALRRLGADISYVEKEGYPPLRIVGKGGLSYGSVSLPGNVSSQYISALMMIGPYLKDGLILTLTDKVISRPYIEMTMSLMRQFGAKVYWDCSSDESNGIVDEYCNSNSTVDELCHSNGTVDESLESNSADDKSTESNVIIVEPGRYAVKSFNVESDWSAASYWYEMVALSSEGDARVLLPGLYEDSLQGDSKGREVFSLLGVKTEYTKDGVLLSKTTREVDTLEYDFVKMPDLAQTFVVTCCMMGVPFHFTGLESLKIKETDRIVALKNEMAKLGFDLEDRNDSELLWDGRRRALTAEEYDSVAIDTYEDHRMAMAFAPVALVNGSIRINNPHVVSKSYPRYWDNLLAAGFQLQQ